MQVKLSSNHYDMAADYIGTVQTKCGRMRGIELTGKYEGITSFRGIPYAAPPVGALRWRPPADPAPWSGIRSCTNYGPVCVQPMDSFEAEPWAGDFYFTGAPSVSEDCLYLNVTTGAKEAGEKRPVYLWFHGGGEDHGYSYETEFNPEELAGKGIVVVSIGHRLNVFGYLALPQLSEEQGGTSGNYALMDEIKALEWVLDNIEAFGGDPDNITAGGQSSGSMKASSLAYTPLGRNHIKRIICESGLSWDETFETLEEAEQGSAEYLEDAGISPELTLDELRRINPYQFLHNKPGKRPPWSLVYDGDLIPNLSLAETVEQYGSEKDYLAGSNLGEQRMNVRAPHDRPGFSSAADFYAFAKELLGDLYEKYDFENLIPVTDADADRESRYLASYGLHNGSDHWGGLMKNRCFGALRAKQQAKGKTFTYLFTRVSPARPEDAGTARDPKLVMTWHSNELWYSFASLREGTPPCRPWEKADFEIADRMSSYWANFIRTGDPNKEGLPRWPAGDQSYAVLELGEEATAIDSLRPVDQLILEYLKRQR